MSNSFCLRITWKYFDKVKCENYIKAFPSFGAMHNTKQPHSHFYVVTDYDSKKLRNDLNRYKTTEKPPKGFKALSISELRTTTGQYYDYCIKKPESVEPFNISIELSYPETTSSSVACGTKKSCKSIIERIEESVDCNLINDDYQAKKDLCKKIMVWYLDRAKVLPTRVVLSQILRTVVARAAYKREREWNGEGIRPCWLDGFLESYARDALAC